MHTQTIQMLRGEVEAVATLQVAFNRLGLQADENALTVWDGPRPDEVADTADDDGGFSHAAIRDLRMRAASALSTRYREVSAAIERLETSDDDMRRHLRQLLGSTLAVGTGGISILKNPNPATQLESLVKAGELRLDLAHQAVRVVRAALESDEVEVVPVKRVAAKKPAKKAAAKKATAKKPARKAAKKPARKTAAKKTAKKTAKKPAAKKAAGRKSPAKKPARR